ncbi:MAG: Ribonuclease HII [Bryobacteraceae bacterium]|nr:Ribonuclease HII [Bryobacteraceae bacterium]
MGAKGAKRWIIRSTYERAAQKQGYLLIAGTDEAGRGSLFGPVFAAAVILKADTPIRGLRDSKQLPCERRELLAARIRERAHAWAVAAVEAGEIDRINIYQASRLAMRRAIEKLNPAPDYLLVDALTVDLPLPQQGIIHGDALCPTIAAASILAKVDRDACMREWDAVYPQYGLCRHKGYSTPEHLEALDRYGPTPQHRMSYEPVRQLSLFSLQEDACR